MHKWIQLASWFERFIPVYIKPHPRWVTTPPGQRARADNKKTDAKASVHRVNTQFRLRSVFRDLSHLTGSHQRLERGVELL